MLTIQIRSYVKIIIYGQITQNCHPERSRRILFNLLLYKEF